jgi:sporulation protein YabP
MTVDERKTNNSMQNKNIIQNIVLENREKLSISGVLDVLSFDDQIVILETELGLLTVKGENLRINKLSLDTSEVIIEGEIYNLGYSEKDLEKKGTTGFLNKLFR